MFLNLMAQYNTSVLIVIYIIEYTAHPPPLLCYRPEKSICRIRDQRILEHVRPTPIPANRNESQNLMPANLSTSAAAVAKSSRKAMLWKSPCLMGAVRMFISNFLNSSPATISKSGAKALAMMIHDGSLPVRLNHNIPAMIAMAVE